MISLFAFSSGPVYRPSDVLCGHFSRAGSPKSIAIVTPSAIDAQADAHVEVTLEVRNGLGLSLPYDSPCCRAAAVCFEVSGTAHLLRVQHQRSADAGWTFSVTLVEPKSPAVTEDVLGRLEAVMQLPGGQKLRSEAVSLRYVPGEKLRHQSESQLLELQALHRRKADLEKHRSQVALLCGRKVEAQKRLEAAEKTLRALPPRSALEQRLADVEQELVRLRGARVFEPPSAELQVHRASSGLDNFLQDRANGRLEPRLAAASVGVVGELGHVPDSWAGDAVAAIAGDKLQVLMVRTERDVDMVWRMPRYKGIKVMALENRGRACPRTTRQGLIDLARWPRLPA